MLAWVIIMWVSKGPLAHWWILYVSPARMVRPFAHRRPRSCLQFPGGASCFAQEPREMYKAIKYECRADRSWRTPWLHSLTYKWVLYFLRKPPPPPLPPARRDMSACRRIITSMCVRGLVVVSLAGCKAETQWVKLCSDGCQVTFKNVFLFLFRCFVEATVPIQ